MSHSPEDEALRLWQDAGQATRAVPQGPVGPVALTAEQRTGIEERLNELQQMKRLGIMEAALALEAVRQVVEVLGHRMEWVDGAWWRLEE